VQGLDPSPLFCRSSFDYPNLIQFWGNLTLKIFRYLVKIRIELCLKAVTINEKTMNLIVNVETILLLFSLGIFVGILSGVLGVGGGLIMVPALTALGFDMLSATATSLVGVMFSSISGSIRNWRTGSLNLTRSLGLVIGGIPGAQLGVWTGAQLPDALLAFAFAGLQILTIYLMTVRQKLQAEPHHAWLDRAETALGMTLRFRYLDKTWFDVPSIAIGMIAGVLSGLFGVGGGVVMVPLQLLILASPIKDAVCASLGAIVLIGISGLIHHAALGHVLWLPGLYLGLGGLVGAQVGTWILPRLSSAIVSTLFRTLLITMSLWMMYQGWLDLEPANGTGLF